MKKTKEVKGNEIGITLIALVITIIVLLILSSVTIVMLAGDNGIITRARESKFKTELVGLKEELDTFKISKKAENQEFQESTLIAGINLLRYNTKSEERAGDISQIMPSIGEKQKSRIDVIKGKMYYITKDKNETKWLGEIGIEVSPFDIENGELKSANSNLNLVDETGVLVIPASVTKIADGAFTNVTGLQTVIIPGTCKMIGVRAFYNNQSLKNVIIEDGVISIDAEAFKKCIYLENIQIADTVNYMRRGSSF